MTKSVILSIVVLVSSACSTNVATVRPPRPLEHLPQIYAFKNSAVQRAFINDVVDLRSRIERGYECCVRRRQMTECSANSAIWNDSWNKAARTASIMRSALPLDDKYKALEAFREQEIHLSSCGE
jgi:hypothetical protein